MDENFYEAELRNALRMAMGTNRVNDLGDSSPFFAKLMTVYPAIGSRIDWSRVLGSIERTEKEESLQVEHFISFFDEVVQKFHLVGDVIYVGDSATDIALAGSIDCMREALPDLLAIPQHHYFIGPESSWCMCFTMEGDMAFGFAPSSTKKH